MSSMMKLARAAVVLVLLAACRGDAPAVAEARAAAPVPAPAPAAAPPAVDTVFPAQEALRRFRQGLREPAGLTGGEQSREALVRRWVRAVEARDSVDMARMMITPAEFAWLYYPESPFTAPPRYLMPETLWMLVQENGYKGYVRVMRRLAGKPFGYAGHDCPGAPRVEGANRLWQGCVVRHASAQGGAAVEMRYFGSIVERDGRFKFMSYANDF